MEYRKLGEFVSLSQGLAINSGTKHLISNEKNEEFVYPLLRIADMMDENFSKYVSKNVNPSVVAKSEDIIYTRTGQIGLVFMGYEGVVHNNSFIVTITNNEVNKEYLFTLLQSSFIKDQALKLAKNSVQPDLTHDMFKSILIPLPDKIIQTKIAEIIKNIALKIDNNNKINAELESMAKTIYDYWFLQFEFPDEEGKPYKSSGGKMVWNEELKREIPEGWEVVFLNEIFDYLEGPGITKDKYSDDNKGQNFINIKCLTDGFVDTTKCSKIKSEFLEVYDKFQLKKDDLVISTSGTLGITGLITETNLPLLLNTSIIRFRPKNEMFYSYMHLFIKSSYFKDLLYQAATGSVQKNVGPTHLNEMKVVKPNGRVIKEFGQITKPLLDMQSNLYKENQELASLRDFLLPLLMNGQVGFKS